MNIQIIMIIKANANDMNFVAKAIHQNVTRQINNANSMLKKGEDANDLVSFEAMEVRPVTKLQITFSFPDDLDKLTKL